MKYIKLALILVLVVSLSACGERSKYKKVMSNPQQLQQTINECGTNKMSKRCETAYIAANVVNQFTNIQRTLVGKYQFTADQMSQIQQAGMVNLELGSTPLLVRFTEMQSDLQGGFAKLIMQMEFNFSAIKTNILKAQQQLRLLKTSDSDQRSKLQADIKTLEKQKGLAEQMIYAMWAFLDLSTGGEV